MTCRTSRREATGPGLHAGAAGFAIDGGILAEYIARPRLRKLTALPASE